MYYYLDHYGWRHLGKIVIIVEIIKYRVYIQYNCVRTKTLKMTDTKIPQESINKISDCIAEETNTFNTNEMTQLKKDTNEMIDQTTRKYNDHLKTSANPSSKQKITKDYYNQIDKIYEQVALAQKEGTDLIVKECTDMYNPKIKGGKRRTRKSGKKARRSKKNNKKRKGKKSKRIRKRK